MNNHYTVGDIAKIRLLEFKKAGIKKSYKAIYKQTLRMFQDGIIPSYKRSVTDNGRVYRYTTDKLLLSADNKIEMQNTPMTKLQSHIFNKPMRNNLRRRL